MGGAGVGAAGRQGEATFEVLSTDPNADFSYRFQVAGDVDKATADGNSADEDDVITDNGDGTVTVTGSTGDGHGDVFTVDGDVQWFTKTGGSSGYRLELDDTDVTGRL